MLSCVVLFIGTLNKGETKCQYMEWKKKKVHQDRRSWPTLNLLNKGKQCYLEVLTRLCDDAYNNRPELWPNSWLLHSPF